jgi:hypothetical protein
MLVAVNCLFIEIEGDYIFENNSKVLSLSPLKLSSEESITYLFINPILIIRK